MIETPTISKAFGYTATGTTLDPDVFQSASVTGFLRQLVESKLEESKLVGQEACLPAHRRLPPVLTPPQKERKMPSTLRLARVVVFDPTEALPLEKRILVMTEEKPTDLTDQELFFELDIKNMLDKHNAVRTETRDKRASEKAGKDVFLEPIRIRGLRMTVLEVPLA